MRYWLFILFLLLASAGFSQEVTGEMRMNTADAFCQNKLKTSIKALYAAKTDEEKARINSQLLLDFEQVLTIPETFDYDFDSLKKYITVLRPDDNRFRLINWNIVKADGTFEYYGFIQSKFTEPKKHKGGKTVTFQLYPLIDKSAEIKNPENAITDNKKWFGMWYYKIITVKTKTRTYYTLLGWDGNDKFTQKRIIDVLSFDNTGVPHFGADIFNYQKKYPKRVIFEYAASCSMSLKYNSKKDSIVFGHLAPTQPQLEGQFQYYCSDMSFDGFGFKKGKWNYGADVNALNEKDEKDKLYHDPHDRSTTSSGSNNYRNVMDENAPTGEGNKVIKHQRVKRNKKAK